MLHADYERSGSVTQLWMTVSQLRIYNRIKGILSSLGNKVTYVLRVYQGIVTCVLRVVLRCIYKLYLNWSLYDSNVYYYCYNYSYLLPSQSTSHLRPNSRLFQLMPDAWCYHLSPLPAVDCSQKVFDSLSCSRHTDDRAVSPAMPKLFTSLVPVNDRTVRPAGTAKWLWTAGLQSLSLLALLALDDHAFGSCCKYSCWWFTLGLVVSRNNCSIRIPDLIFGLMFTVFYCGPSFIAGMMVRIYLATRHGNCPLNEQQQ